MKFENQQKPWVDSPYSESEVALNANGLWAHLSLQAMKGEVCPKTGGDDAFHGA